MRRLTAATVTAGLRRRAQRAATTLAVVAWGVAGLATVGAAGLPTYHWTVKHMMVNDLTILKDQAARFSYLNGDGKSVYDKVPHIDHAADLQVPDNALGEAYMSVVPHYGTWKIDTDGSVTYTSTLPQTDICLTMKIEPAAAAGYPGGGEWGDANTEQANITDCGSDTLTDDGTGLTPDGKIAGDTSSEVTPDDVKQALTDAGLTGGDLSDAGLDPSSDSSAPATGAGTTEATPGS